MYTKLNASRSYVYAVARACDHGKVSRRVSLLLCPWKPGISSSFQDCAGAILYSTEKSIEVALEAMQCLGGNGYINGSCSVPLLCFLGCLILASQITRLEDTFVMHVCTPLVLEPKKFAAC